MNLNLSHYGWAMKDLDVELILAHSPPAKGRVYCCNAVFQDRLVKALRLKEISVLEGTNAFLDEECLGVLNDKIIISVMDAVTIKSSRYGSFL